jgi:Porphyromonas-type peptidyl-arginine deiminase
MAESGAYRSKRSQILYAVGGVAVGLLAAVGVLRVASRSKAPPPPTPSVKLAGGILREDAGSLEEILVHYVPRLEPLVQDAYADFLGTIDPATRLVVVLPRTDADDGETPQERLGEMLARIDPSGGLGARARPVEVDGPISVWSKDRALVLGPDAEASRAGLVIPVPPDPHWKERANDWRTLAQVAGAMPERFYVRQLPLAFDAGDFDVAGGRVLVDDNLVTKNRSRGVSSVQELSKLVEGLLARPVLVLGASDGDVPRHHMSMYMAALDGGVALVGDPRAGMAVVGQGFVPGEIDPDTGEPLRADFSDAMVARFDHAAADLAAAGWKVVRIPEVPFLDKTYMAYTNGVYETRGGKRIAWMPTFNLPELDARARAVYESLGWQVRPVRARALYAWHGTIGCLVNVLARGDR